jgi:hypothetical protein
MTTCTEKHHPNHTHKHGPNCGHTAVRHESHIDYLHDGHLHHTRTTIMSTSTSSRSMPPTPYSARHRRAARTSMARPAGTKPCPMVITSIISWADACIIRMMIVATTTVLCSWPDHRLRPRSGPYFIRL